jgi:hypothetical protein
MLGNSDNLRYPDLWRRTVSTFSRDEIYAIIIAVLGSATLLAFKFL